MTRPLTIPGILLLFPLTLHAAAAAQNETTPQTAEPPREVQAIRATTAPVIDGDLSDPVWSEAPEITGFTQRDPNEGEPATERTIIRIAYDESALYIAAQLDDSSGEVTTRLGRRDNSLESDWLYIWLDPHLDRQSGAGFWVNPSNVQIDMVLYNDGWEDWNWDAVWSSATAISEKGWTAEVRIPYSQLRFPEREEHVWGVNFGRRIVRNNESVRLVHIPKNERGFVSRFAHLTGIRGISPPSSLELMPYAVTRADLSENVAPGDPFNDSTEYDGAIGLDLKYGLTSNLTLTGTLNPDFGQVEVDPAVVNLSQFEQFFPEKRPFFVEGSNLFAFGQGGSNHNFGFNFFAPSFFYSRRIGRSPQGRVFADYVEAPGESTILGAGKLTGKTPSGWSIGVLDAVTEKETATFQLNGTRGSQVIEPMSNYFVGRLAKDLGEKSKVGVLFTSVHRDLPTEMTGLHQSAYSGGLDGYRFFGDEKDVVWEWFVGGSQVRGSAETISLTQRSPARYYTRPDAGHVDFDPDRTSLSGWAARTMVGKQTGKWKYNLKAEAYSPGFETNDIGFMQRSDILATHAVLLYNNPDPWKKTRSRNFWVGKFQHWNLDGDRIADGLASNWNIQFTNYWYAFGWLGGSNARYDDRHTRGGPVAELPGNWYEGGGFGSDSRKPIWFEVWRESAQNTEGGWSHAGGMVLGFKPTSNLSVQVSPYFSRYSGFSQYVRTVADPLATHTYGNRYVFSEIEQRTLELGTRLDWTLNARLSLQLYLQPFVASGDYHTFKELARPRGMDYLEYGEEAGTITYDEATNRYLVDPDGAGAAASFTFGNPDFNFRSLRGSAVLRWEFRPGSSLYFVWNENRASVDPIGDFSLRRDLSETLSAPADDVFLIKVSYWWAR